MNTPINADLAIVKYLQQTDKQIVPIISDCPARDVCPSMEIIFKQRKFIVFVIKKSQRFDILHLQLIDELFKKYIAYSIGMFEQQKVLRRKAFQGKKIVDNAIKEMQQDNKTLRQHYITHNADKAIRDQIDEMIDIINSKY
jgi:hypothetical protein